MKQILHLLLSYSGWIIGSILILSSLVGLSQGQSAAFLLLIAGIVCIPVFPAYFSKYIGMDLAPKWRWSSFAILFMSAGALLPKDESKPVKPVNLSTKSPDTVVVKKEPEPKKDIVVIPEKVDTVVREKKLEASVPAPVKKEPEPLPLSAPVKRAARQPSNGDGVNDYRPRSSQRYTRGSRGGCYYINSNGKKTYVDRSLCN